MSKKKIFIWFLIFTFTLSNVGLPFTLHICNTMKKVSLDECKMCKFDDEKTESSCCEKKFEDVINKVSFKNNCCDSKLAAKPIKENFVSSQFALKKTESVSSINIDNQTLESKLNFAFRLYFDTSPPIQNSNSLNILYSTFLI